MTPDTFKVACSNCNLRELCMPVGFDNQDMKKLDEVVAKRHQVKQGQMLFANGDEFTSLYAIRTGFFKTCISNEDGREQVTGFQMAGEIIGVLNGMMFFYREENVWAIDGLPSFNEILSLGNKICDLLEME